MFHSFEFGFPGKWVAVLAFFFWALLAADVEVTRSQTNKTVYRVGVVPQFGVPRILKIWKPILAAISQKTGLRFELHPSPSIPKFEKALDDGLFDFAYMNPFHLLVAHDRRGYIPLLRDTGRTLYGIIVVRKDSPLKNIRDLEGKTVAFPAPNALGASLMPRAEFANRYGINIKPMYVRSHTSVYMNVFLKQVVAGGGVRATFDKQDLRIVNGLKVFFETSRTAPHPIAAHPRVPPGVRQKLVQAFMELGSSDQGARLLAQIPMRKIGLANLADYEPLRDLKLEEFYVQP